MEKLFLKIEKVGIPELNYQVEWQGEEYTVKTKGLSESMEIIIGKLEIVKDGKAVLESGFAVSVYLCDDTEKRLNSFLENINGSLMKEQQIKMTEENLRLFFKELFETYFNLMEEVKSDPNKSF